MTEKDFLKYHQKLYDMQENIINPDDTVVINNNYYGTPIIATVSHFTRNGKVALYRKRTFGNSQIIVRYYRRPESVIKIKDGNKN